MEQYHVDYVALCKSFYSAEGDMMVTSVTYEGLPPIAAEFDVTYWARAAISKPGGFRAQDRLNL